MKPQLQKGAEISLTNYLSSKTQFLAQNQPFVAQNFQNPQKALLLMLKHIISKYEGPTLKEAEISLTNYLS